MADPYVRQSRGVVQAKIGSTAVVAGDLVYFDGTDWELADADDNTKFAEAIAVHSYKSGEEGTLCTAGIIVDTDAPYTQGSSYYLSATAGALTATRPTGAENLCQIVGFGLSTTELKADIQPLHEETINLMFPYVVSGAPDDRDNDYLGKGLDDTSAEVGSAFMCPQNEVELVIAYLWWCGTGTLLDSGDTYTIDVSGGIDDETTSTTTDGITAASLAVAANDLNRADVSNAFDGAGLLKPGNVLGVAIKKDAEGSEGDDPIMLCLSLVIRCV